MGLPEDISLSPGEAKQVAKSHRATCRYTQTVIADEPTHHDLQVALSSHAQACRECAILLHTYLQDAATARLETDEA